MLPIVVTRPLDGANGRNWPGLVILDPRAAYPAAVAAQEVWESRHKLNPLNLLRVRLSKSAQRAMELMGHEVEVQAVARFYDGNPAMHRRSEARAMLRGYGGLFRDWSETRLIGEMERRTVKAARWVSDNRQTLRRYLEA